MDPTHQRASWTATILLVGLVLLLSFALVGQLIAVVPAYERQFEDFRMRLPFLTEMVILASRIVVKYWFLLAPCFLAAFALVIWLSYLIRHQCDKKWLSATWCVLLIGLPLVANALLWAALWIPFKQLQDALAK